jgi:hypothetical protein
VTQPAPPDAAAPAALVAIVIESAPRGALVMVDGRPRGRTPLELHLPRGARPMELVLRHADHLPLARRLVPDVDQRLHLALVPLPRKARPRPRPAPDRPAPADFRRFE